jgi:hypothetical protein
MRSRGASIATPPGVTPHSRSAQEAPDPAKGQSPLVDRCPRASRGGSFRGTLRIGRAHDARARVGIMVVRELGRTGLRGCLRAPTEDLIRVMPAEGDPHDKTAVAP